MSDQSAPNAPKNTRSQERFLSLKEKLQNGQLNQLTEEAEAEPLRKLKSRLYRYAIWLLGRSELSRGDLQNKISRFVERKQAKQVKSFDVPPSELSELIEGVLDQLAEQNYQSNERASRSLVRSQVFKGRGQRRIEQELKQKQLDPELVAHELGQVNWVIQAAELRLKKYGLPLPVGPKEKARQTRFLAYRGFDFQIIRRVLETEIDELREEFDDPEQS